MSQEYFMAVEPDLGEPAWPSGQTFEQRVATVSNFSLLIYVLYV